MAPTEETQTVEVNKEDLRRAGDLIVMRLMEVQSYIADLGKAYVQHVKTMTESGDAVLELPVGPSGFMGNNFNVRATSPGAKSDAGGPKKRKRAPADPNAPKRALTPYFLYMQHNRSKIAGDLGGDARPKDVADEGTRRWQSMEPAEKETWKQLYATNYNEYKEAMALYKATGQTPKADTKEDEHDDPAASQLQQGFVHAEAEAEETESSSSSDDEEESPSPPSPPKVKSPPKEKSPPRSSAKKGRRSETKAKEVETPAKSPVKRLARKAAAVAEPASAAKTPAENKRKTKKRKSEA